MSPLIVQILPRLTPGRCGLSDHAVSLAGELRTGFGIETAFAVLNSEERSNVPYRTIYCTAPQLLESCAKLPRDGLTAVLAHISGYGYSADGAPFQLAEALRELRDQGQFRTAAYFHETVASGPPWSRIFWQMRRQKRSARKILAACDLVVTSIARQAELLEHEAQRGGGISVERMPVFSNAGESEAPPPITQRRAAMLVFGLAETRRSGYQKLSGAGDLLRTLGIREIIDVGPACECPQNMAGIPVRTLGLVPAEELPTVFSEAQFGFVPHPWFCLGKSGLFAAYCAHGTIPVLAGDFPEPADGLQDGVQVVSARTAESVRRSGWESCSNAAWTWYSTHRLHVHAERYAKWMAASV